MGFGFSSSKLRVDLLGELISAHEHVQKLGTDMRHCCQNQEKSIFRAKMKPLDQLGVGRVQAAEIRRWNLQKIAVA